MKKLLNSNKGFTLIEVLISTSVGVIVIASLLNLIVVTQRFSAGILNQIIATTAAKNPTDMLYNDIREAVRIDVWKSYTDVTPAKNGDYIHVHFPATFNLNPVGYYVINDTLYKVTDLTSDDAGSTLDDKIITEGIKNKNTFRQDTPLVLRVKFNIQIKSESQGKTMTSHVDTYINLRN